jgi:hypothetical protein
MLIRKLRIVVDTNLWLSFLITKKYAKLDTLLDSKKIQLLFSAELIEEILEVSSRPKFKKYFTQNDLEKLIAIFDSIGEQVKVKSNVKDFRDIKDNFLLNLAIDGRAKYLISGDLDLLSLKQIEKTKIISMTHFLELL